MPLNDVQWLCNKCGSISDTVYRDGTAIKLRDALVEAYHTAEAAEHELVLFCEKCNDAVGYARVPTGSDAFVYVGDVVFIYSLTSEGITEISEAGDKDGERERTGETG